MKMRRADQRKFHYIYKIVRFDGKFYIGLHSTDNLEDGYFGSGTLISRSMKKYGKENHKKEILEFCDSREQVRLRESEIVNEDCLSDPNCMNLKLGGIGGWEHIDQAAIDKRRATTSATLKGRSFSADHKEAISKATIGNRNFQKAWGVSRPVSQEHREKISQTRRERQCGVGEKNSQFGSCWVTNGVKPIKIKKERLDEYIRNGYSRGRKII